MDTSKIIHRGRCVAQYYDDTLCFNLPPEYRMTLSVAHFDYGSPRDSEEQPAVTWEHGLYGEGTARKYRDFPTLDDAELDVCKDAWDHYLDSREALLEHFLLRSQDPEAHKSDCQECGGLHFEIWDDAWPHACFHCQGACDKCRGVGSFCASDACSCDCHT